MSAPILFPPWLEYLNYLEMPVAFWLPSGWYYFSVAAALRGVPDFIYFFELIGFCGVVYSSLLFAADKFYLRSLSKKDYIRVIKPSKIKDVLPGRAILKNDLRLFFREPQRWTQLILLFGIFIVYLVSIYKISADTVYLTAVVAFLNTGLVGFITAALALRFIFPIFSMEAKTWWALISAPLTAQEIVRAKYLLYEGGVVFIGLTLAVYSNLILKIEPEIFLTSVLSILVISSVLSVLALYLSIRFSEDKIFKHS